MHANLVSRYCQHVKMSCDVNLAFNFIVYKDEGFGYLTTVKELAQKAVDDARREVQDTPTTLQMEM